MSNDKPEDRTEEEEEAPDPSFKPVEGFLRNEIDFRFPIDQPEEMPVHLFDSTSEAKRQTSPPSLTQNETRQYYLQKIGADQSEDPLSEETVKEKAKVRKARGKKLVTKLWEQLSRFYDREGYEGLHAMKESLEKRKEREHRRIRRRAAQADYRAFLKTVVSTRAEHHGAEQSIVTALDEPGIEEGITWSVPDKHANYVQLKVAAERLEEKDIDKEKLDNHPFILENTTWAKARATIGSAALHAKERFLKCSSTLQMLRLRRRLVRRKLWLVDMGLPHENPPELYTVPAKLRGKKQAVKYCLMIFQIFDETKDEGGWASQPELKDILERAYDFDDRTITTNAVVTRASSLIESRTGWYRDFRPDFYLSLKRRSHFLQFVADELDLDVPKPDGHEDQA